MQVLNCFDHLFVLNMAEDSDRMLAVSHELKSHGISFERIDAPRCSATPKITVNHAWGCAQAHRTAVQLAAARRYKNIVIAEDDLILRGNFRELWTDIIDEIKKVDYDLFYFYQWDKILPPKKPIEVVQIAKTRCTHLYVVNSGFYGKFLDMTAFQNQREVRAIDTLFSAPECKIFAPTYNLAGQRSCISSSTGRYRKRTAFSQFDL